MPTEMKLLLVTGPRTWGEASHPKVGPLTEDEPTRIAQEREAVFKIVGRLPADLVVMHGAAKGLDSLIAEAAIDHGLVVVPVPYFGFLGRSGGHARNAAMVVMAAGLRNSGWTVKCWAFGDVAHGGGTANCAAAMEKAELPVKWWPRPVQITVPS